MSEFTREPGADKIIWERGRRNMVLCAQGSLAVICPVRDGSGVGGICIFTVKADETKSIMDGDPAVLAGVLTYEFHPTSTCTLS